MTSSQLRGSLSITLKKIADLETSPPTWKYKCYLYRLGWGGGEKMWKTAFFWRCHPDGVQNLKQEGASLLRKNWVEIVRDCLRELLFLSNLDHDVRVAEVVTSWTVKISQVGAGNYGDCQLSVLLKFTLECEFGCRHFSPVKWKVLKELLKHFKTILKDNWILRKDWENHSLIVDVYFILVYKLHWFQNWPSDPKYTWVW